MNLKEFTAKIQELDPRFSTAENPNRPGLANIFFKGANYDLPVISSQEIPDEPNPNAVYVFPSGTQARLWAVPEVIGRLEDFLKMEKDGKLDEEYGD